MRKERQEHIDRHATFIILETLADPDNKYIRRFTESWFRLILPKKNPIIPASEYTAGNLLQKMENDKLIERVIQPGKHCYIITEQGREHFAMLKAQQTATKQKRSRKTSS